MPSEPAAEPDLAAVDRAAVERLRSLIRVPTVSRNDPADEDRAAFSRLRATLAELYPLTFRELEIDVIGGDGLLLRWAGEGTGAPAVLMAHQDVVPADEPGWQHGAFDADLAGEGDELRVWGRGAIDDKGMLAVILEAVEARLLAGFRPSADVYLSFGANEETAGDHAEAAVALLVERGIRPGLVIDEGGAVAEGAFPGVAGAVAFVGVSEKGLAGIELSVEKPGGHAATPARGGATTTLARAILRLERHPAPASLSAPLLGMLRALAPRASGAQRRIFERPELFRPLVTRVLAGRGGEGEAMVRTTRAVTRLSGSAGDNVVAERATAMVNARIAVGSSVEYAVRDMKRAIADDGVGIRVVYGNDPAPVSPHTGPEWELLAAAITDTFPDTIVAPYIMLQASDSRHFATISPTVYRFLPFDLTLAERGTLHAKDESIRVSTYLRGIRFFDRLIGAL